MRNQGPIVAVVSLGGMIGALLRYGIGTAWTSGFPWATMTINAVGCGAMGALIVLVTEVWPSQKLLRPFLGTGVLGGFTTFSTYASDGITMLDRGQFVPGVLYLMATPLIALTAVFAAFAFTTRLVERRVR